MANKSRPKQVILRMTEEEYELLKRKVEKSGMKQQEYMLKAVLDKPITNTNGIKMLMPELKRIGINLNQVAHYMNMGFKHPQLERNQKELSEIWQQLKQCLPNRKSEL